jgi:hypothetical protein
VKKLFSSLRGNWGFAAYIVGVFTVSILVGVLTPTREAHAQVDARGIYNKKSLTLVAAGVTPAASDTVITVERVFALVNTAGQTSYTISTGKSLVIQGIYLEYTQSSATAARVQVFFRYNSAGACVAGSTRVLATELASPSFGTSAAFTGSDAVMMPIPWGGLEIKGDGTASICFSAIASSAAGTLTLSLVGFEY